MPDISYSVSYRISKDFLNSSVAANNISANMSLAGLQSQTLTLSTNAVSISTAANSTCAIGIEAGGSFVGFTTLRAGEPAIMRLTPGTNYRAIGTSGTRIRVDITEG